MQQQLQKLAQLALLSQQGKCDPLGNAPSSSELAALLDGKLDFKRKQQVFGHLNRNPALFSQWVDLVDAQHDVQEPNPSNAFKFEFQLRSLNRLFRFPFLFSESVAVVIFSAVLFSYIHTDIRVTHDDWQSVGEDIVKTSGNDALTQLNDFVSEVNAHCLDYLSSDTHRKEYRDLLAAMYGRLVAQNETNATETNNEGVINKDKGMPPQLKNIATITFESAEQACQFNRSLLNGL